MSRRFATVAGLMLSCLSGLVVMHIASAADHRDAPALLTENGGDRSLDLNDVYVFRSPGNSANTVFILTVNPLSIPGDQPDFSSNGTYEFNVDTDGDAVEDLTFVFEFKPERRGKQVYSVTQIRNASTVLTRNAETGRAKNLAGGIKVIADLYDDPFFFDFDAFRGTDGEGDREFNDGAENDFFEGFNVSAIVMEIPNRLFRARRIGVWSATTRRAGRRLIQVDRTALPAINPVFIRPNRFFNPGGNLKNEFNFGHPFFDRDDFFDEAVAVLTNPDGFNNDLEYAEFVASVVLPDIMPFDTNSGAGFLNGRRLRDDVIDLELGIVTNGGLTTDGVPENDKAFRNTFPYLATPHTEE